VSGFFIYFVAQKNTITVIECCRPVGHSKSVHWFHFQSQCWLQNNNVSVYIPFPSLCVSFCVPFLYIYLCVSFCLFISVWVSEYLCTSVYVCLPPLVCQCVLAPLYSSQFVNVCVCLSACMWISFWSVCLSLSDHLSHFYPNLGCQIFIGTTYLKNTKLPINIHAKWP
jgi:hypothetical protein